MVPVARGLPYNDPVTVGAPDNGDPVLLYRDDKVADQAFVKFEIGDESKLRYEIGYNNYWTGDGDQWKSVFSIYGDGSDVKTGINMYTSLPQATLDVNGTARVSGDLTVLGAIKIGASGWSISAPDYVFEKDYKLMSLDSVDRFVTENGHLPNVPSAQEMNANGVDVVEMNFALLRKVEELTLHAIRMEKELAMLKAAKDGEQK